MADKKKSVCKAPSKKEVSAQPGARPNRKRTSAKSVGKKPSSKRVSASHFIHTPSSIKLAPGALTRLFGDGNEPNDTAFVSDSELILEDAKMNPHLYPALSKPKRRRVNPSGKSGYYKRGI